MTDSLQTETAINVTATWKLEKYETINGEQVLVETITGGDDLPTVKESHGPH